MTPLIFFVRFCRGFTLLELLVVLALVGILAGLAVPAMNTFVRNQRISSLTSEILTDITWAQNKSANNSNPIIICARAAGAGANACDPAATNFNNGWIIFEDAMPAGAPNATIDPGDNVYRRHEPLRDTLALRQITSPVTSVGGSCAGGASTTDRITYVRKVATVGTGCFTICDDRNDANQGRNLVVPRNGQPRLERPATACP
jgi:prepilin-type N-terminal cleavage/methylation domain-containing protein